MYLVKTYLPKKIHITTTLFRCLKNYLQGKCLFKPRAIFWILFMIMIMKMVNDLEDRLFSVQISVIGFSAILLYNIF